MTLIFTFLRPFLASRSVVWSGLVWSGAVALGLGLGELLLASKMAYNLLKWIGAAYLLYLGVKLLINPRSQAETDWLSVECSADWQ